MRDRVMILLVGLLAGLVVAAWLPSYLPTYLGGPSPEPRAITPRGALAPSEETTIALFQQTKPSVVAITTAQQVVDPYTRRRQQVPQGVGSGFMWDDQGHIVTNNHVIAKASSAKVQLADGRVMQAKLVGTDPVHDIAVLQISGPNLPPPLPIGRSKDLQVGQSVLAIGNPFGLDWTLTTGVVSALEREIPESGGETMGGLIQTDAAINPGNSGGPLIDSAGRLIGINAAIFSPSGSSAGIGFAIPVDAVNRVVPQLIAQGHFSPPVLGVSHDDRVNQLAHRNGLQGVVVLDVQPGSPAAKAGLKPARSTGNGIVPGDIITGFDGAKVNSSDDLRNALSRHEPGDKVTLEVQRDGSPTEIKLALAAP